MFWCKITKKCPKINNHLGITLSGALQELDCTYVILSTPDIIIQVFFSFFTMKT